MIDQTFSKIRKENSPEIQQAAYGMLSMILKNIIDHPNVPRYKRVKSDNTNFSKLLSPLKYHAEFLIALGFTKRGNYFEYDVKTKLNEASSRQDIEKINMLHDPTLNYGIELIENLRSKTGD